MPLVTIHRESEFFAAMRYLRNTGKTGAYKKACEIRQSLELGEFAACQTTDHGESRIRNCVKYDLGNGYRLVTIDFKEVIILCYAGHHVEVDKWIVRHEGHVFTYDKETKKVGLIVEKHVIKTTFLPAATMPPEDSRPYLEQIGGLDWDILIPSKSIRRAALKLSTQSDEDEILEVLGDINGEVSSAVADLVLSLVTALRDGKCELAERHRDLFLGHLARASEETPLTAEIVKAESNSDTLIVLNDLSPEEFDDLWSPSRFQEWMLFLHPGQKRVVVEDIPKPCVFTGVSGSGKTCVLVHRAIRLAKEYPGEPILVLTLNRPLADLIRNHIDRLAGAVKYPIRVMAFYEYLESMLKFYGMEDFLTSFGSLLELKDEVNDFIGGRKLTELNTLFDARDEYEIETLWNAFCADPKSQPTKDALSRLTVYLFSQDQAIDAHRYLKEELTLVRSACRLSSAYEGYAKYDRGGRCIQFQDKRRDDILRVLRTWERYQLRHGKLDGMELTQAATVALDDHEGSIPDHLRFRCVLVDEFQDFSTLDLELISKIPKEPLNGLFLTGDTAQKIYTKDFDLPQAGLGPGHRVNRSILKNYRNSRQILEAAHLLLESYANEATAKHEGVTVLKPEYAQRDGARPFVCETNDSLKAAWSLAGEWLASGYPGFSICIATANPDVISVRKIRETAPPGIATSRLTGDYQMRADVVVVSDIYNIKGFEFSLIVIVGLGEGEFPPKGVPAGEVWREALRLYVAMTRGRDEVCLIYRGAPSPFITVMAPAVSPRPLNFEPAQETITQTSPGPEVVELVEVIDDAKTAAPPEEIAPIKEAISPQVDMAVPELPAPIAAPVVESVVVTVPSPEVEIESPVAFPPAPDSHQAHPAQEATVINGVVLLPIVGAPTVRKVATALGRDFAQIHNDFMNLGVYSRPDQAIVRTFVFKVMAKYDCAPLFKN